MILDTLDQWPRYAQGRARFAAAFQFLEKLPTDLPDGRHNISGDDIYALAQTYPTKPRSPAIFEAHRTYIDIQFLQTGRETILWAPLSDCTTVTQPYLPEKDAALFAAPSTHTALHLYPGHFAIFFPTDAHAPCLDLDGSTQVRKIVIKVRES